MTYLGYTITIDHMEEAKLMTPSQKRKIEQTIVANLKEVIDTYIKDLFKNDIDYVMRILEFEDEEHFYLNLEKEKAFLIQESLAEVFYDNICDSSPEDIAGRSIDWKRFESFNLLSVLEEYSDYFKDNDLEFINEIAKSIENPTVGLLYDKLGEIVDAYYSKYHK